MKYGDGQHSWSAEKNPTWTVDVDWTDTVDKLKINVIYVPIVCMNMYMWRHLGTKSLVWCLNLKVAYQNMVGSKLWKVTTKTFK